MAAREHWPGFTSTTQAVRNHAQGEPGHAGDIYCAHCAQQENTTQDCRNYSDRCYDVVTMAIQDRPAQHLHNSNQSGTRPAKPKPAKSIKQACP